jgi:hypothetical protein
MAANPTALFCVGATKAGTGWPVRLLQDQPDCHPDCHARAIKELHYFDALDRQNCDWQVAKFHAQRRTVATRIGDANFANQAGLARQHGGGLI